ncbi:ABC transporter substrate-binding protein [Rhodococcoides fascians]|uniref:ABC transporter substrate-binding protein n=1 Tax=Rhodococcoides fascians TaxID=1828 RepID=UPI0005693D98|nr:ABC transporter substrate-binding protein [Rhodococcus fascians]
MFQRRAFKSIAALSITALCATACASGGGSEATEDRTFRYASSFAPVNLDPQLGSADYADLPFLWPVYDRLTYINEDGVVEPQLAESWELAPDGSTFTLHLRDGVTFSDGAILNAEAVKANLERGINEARAATFEQLARTVSNIVVVDDLTVRLDLTGPGGPLPFLLGDRAGIIVSPDALNNPDLDQHPVGAGAFELVNSTPGSSYTYERRDDYWNDDEYKFQRLEVTVQTEDATRLNAVRSGQQDATRIRESQVDEAEAAGLDIHSRPGLSFYSFTMNTKRSKLGDKRVRQALSLAMDRDSIDDGVFGGRCPSTAQPFPADYFAHSDDPAIQNDWGEYDADRARTLLAEAGLADGLEFTAVVPNVTAYQTLAQVLKEQFAQIGITMNLEVIDAAQVGTQFASGEVDAVIGSWAGGVDPSVYAGAYYLGGPSNPGGATTDEIRQLNDAANFSTDLDERSKAYADLLSAVYDFGPHDLPICSSGRYTAARSGIEGLKSYLTTGTWEFRDVTLTSQN